MVRFGGGVGSTGKGILIGILSAFGSAGVAIIILGLFFFFRYTQCGRVILDRIGRPGEYDDEQAFAREEAEALESMDELQQTEYLRAKGKIPICKTSRAPVFCIPGQSQQIQLVEAATFCFVTDIAS